MTSYRNPIPVIGFQIKGRKIPLLRTADWSYKEAQLFDDAAINTELCKALEAAGCSPGGAKPPFQLRTGHPTEEKANFIRQYGQTVQRAPGDREQEIY